MLIRKDAKYSMQNWLFPLTIVSDRIQTGAKKCVTSLLLEYDIKKNVPHLDSCQIQQTCNNCGMLSYPLVAYYKNNIIQLIMLTDKLLKEANENTP